MNVVTLINKLECVTAADVSTDGCFISAENSCSRKLVKALKWYSDLL